MRQRHSLCHIRKRSFCPLFLRKGKYLLKESSCHICIATLVLVVVLVFPAYAGVTHEAYYEGDAGQLSADMTPYQGYKMDFLIPRGWKQTPWLSITSRGGSRTRSYTIY